MVLQKRFTLSALLAIAQSKAVVTNLCPKDVYVWSVPRIGGFAENQRVKAHGGQYIEEFHTGTDITPAIAIKVSPEPYGIFVGKEEIDFSYTVDPVPNGVWVNLYVVRGYKRSFQDATFHTCNGPYKGPEVPTRLCNLNDNVELVLCGSTRRSPEEDQTPTDLLSECLSPKMQERQANKTLSTRSRRPRLCLGHVSGPNKTQEMTPKKAVREEPNLETKGDTESPRVDKMPKVQPVKKARNDTLSKGTPKPPHASGMNVTPHTFAEKYSKPLLRLVWLSACDIASKENWDCLELKDAIKATYPDVDEADKHHRARNGTKNAHLVHLTKSPAGNTKKGEQGKRVSDKEKACKHLLAFVGDDMPGHPTCDEAIKLLKMVSVYTGKKISVDDFTVDSDSASSSELEEEFERTWPNIDWTTDDDSDSD